MFPLLVYNKQENGGFCLLSTSTGYHGSNPGVLVSCPLTTFSKALELTCKHADKEHHKTAVVQADNFKKTMSSQQPSIMSRINKSMADRITTKSLVLSLSVILCGRQNLPLHGHRDSAANIESRQ